MNVNHTRRWGKTWVAARETVALGRIGDLVTVIGQVRRRAGDALAKRSHIIDIMNYFVDANPIWVVGELEPAHADYGTRYHGDGGRDASLEPAANAYWAYDNGVRAFLSGMKTAAPILAGRAASARKARLRSTIQQARLEELTENGVVTSPIIPGLSMGGMQAAVADLLTALENGRRRNRRRARHARPWRSSKAFWNRRPTATIASISARLDATCRPGSHLRRRARAPGSAVVRLHLAGRTGRRIVPLLFSRGAWAGPSGRQIAHHGEPRTAGIGRWSILV